MYNQFVIFVTFHILQGKWQHFKRCGGKCYTYLAVNLVRLLMVKKFWKSFNNWQSYHLQCNGFLFWTTLYCVQYGTDADAQRLVRVTRVLCSCEVVWWLYLPRCQSVPLCDKDQLCSSSPSRLTNASTCSRADVLATPNIRLVPNSRLDTSIWTTCNRTHHTTLFTDNISTTSWSVA